MKKRYIFLLIFLSVFQFGCNKKDVEFVPPSVITLHSETYEKGGVSLHGKFLNFNDKDELGFLIFGSNTRIDVSFDKPNSELKNVKIEAGLHINEIYKYLAYIKTEDEIFYGLEEEFLSTGSKAVSLKSATPTSGNYRDIVELVFDEVIPVINEQTGLKILFNDKYAQITNIIENKVTCKVPYFSDKSEAKIKIEYYGKIIPTSQVFTLNSPEIIGVSLKEVTFFDETIIYGENFEDFNSQFLSVYFDGFEAEIIDKSKKEIKVKIPKEIIRAKPTIKVVSNLKEVTKSDLIELKSPKINSYPVEANIFDEIEIIGENFNPDYFKNYVYFNDTKAFVVGGSLNRLIVKVPAGIYNDWTPNIQIKISTQIQSELYSLSILDSGIEVSDSISQSILGYQVLNDQLYVYGSEGNRDEIIVWKYSEKDNIFYDRKEISLPAIHGRSIINSKDGYLYLHYYKKFDNFFKINIVTGELEKLNNFPFENEHPILTAISDGDLVFGYGFKFRGTQGEVFKYSVKDNTWSQMESLEHFTVYKSFYSSKSNESYFLAGVYSNAKVFYKFNGSKYEKSSLTLPSLEFKDYMSFNFFHDDKFYFLEASGKMYNPNRMMILDVSTNIWKEIPNILPKASNITGVFQKENLLFIQVIDFYAEYHLYKVDLSLINI